MTTKPYSWIQTLTDALKESRQIPLWGSAPAFPWEKCAQDLTNKFSCEKIEISAEQTLFRKHGSLLDGLGVSPFLTPLNATPLEGTFFWAMGLEDVKRLTAILLTQSKQDRGFTDERFVSGFYRYLSLEILETLQALNPLHDLSFKLAEQTPLPEEETLCIDVKITIEGHPFWGRLISPPSFHKSFKSHFAKEKVDISSKGLASSLDIALRLEAGSTTLSFQEWKALTEGDLIVLDHCNYDPTTLRGTLEIVLGKTPLFQARLKEGALKILDYSFYYEEEKLMDEPNAEEENLLPETPYTEIPGEMGELPPEEELPYPEGEGTKHMWAEEKGEAPLEKMLAASEVPISLTVEVGRLHMSLEKLLELQPGNTLELTTRPEDGVSVTMQGKRVAHAELVKIGDVLGIKILKLGR